MLVSVVYITLCVVLAAHPTVAADSTCPADSCFQDGDIRKCLAIPNTPTSLMRVLPGGGFDNIRNLDMGLVHNYKYSSCQISRDGKFLLPDNVFLLPVQASNFRFFSEYLDHWDNYTDITSHSINVAAEAKFLNIHGKYSEGYMNTKTNQVNHNAKTTRTQLRYTLYNVMLQPEAELHPQFKQALIDIGDHIQNNYSTFANYLAQVLVRDYGTHYLTRIDAGAVVAKMDELNSSYVGHTSNRVSKTMSEAGASFFESLSLNVSIHDENTNEQGVTNAYDNSVVNTQLVSYGGPVLDPTNFVLNEWTKGIPETLVPIDRHGKPLHFAITTKTLPNYPEVTVYKIANTVESAINQYYKENYIGGCTDPNSQNFNFQANLDDNSCELSATNFTFGGVYQTCTPTKKLFNNLCTLDNVAQVNTLTGKYSCPPDYTPIKLHKGKVTKTTSEPDCHDDCVLGFFFCNCHPKYHLDEATYETYWCAALNTQANYENNGYLFGGFYTPAKTNPVTGTKACPRYFQPLRILKDVHICVSSDYELGSTNSIRFGGFFACDVGNPLTSTNFNNMAQWPHRCPHGTSQHLLTIEENCEVNFCLEAGALRTLSLPSAKLPPFVKRPEFKANTTETIVVAGLQGRIWVKNTTTNQWYLMQTGVKQSDELYLEHLGVNMNPGANANNQQPAVIGLSIFSTILFVALVIVVIAFIAYKHRHRHA